MEYLPCVKGSNINHLLKTLLIRIYLFSLLIVWFYWLLLDSHASSILCAEFLLPGGSAVLVCFSSSWTSELAESIYLTAVRKKKKKHSIIIYFLFWKYQRGNCTNRVWCYVIRAVMSATKGHWYGRCTTMSKENSSISQKQWFQKICQQPAVKSSSWLIAVLQQGTLGSWEDGKTLKCQVLSGAVTQEHISTEWANTTQEFRKRSNVRYGLSFNTETLWVIIQRLFTSKLIFFFFFFFFFLDTFFI